MHAGTRERVGQPPLLIPEVSTTPSTAHRLTHTTRAHPGGAHGIRMDVLLYSHSPTSKFANLGSAYN
eukprot:801814-Prymnesium_polylepis.1